MTMTDPTPSAPAGEPHDDKLAKRRRTNKIILIVIGSVVAALVGLVVLIAVIASAVGGDSDNIVTSAPAPSRSAAAVEAADTSAEDEAAAQKAAEDKAARDLAAAEAARAASDAAAAEDAIRRNPDSYAPIAARDYQILVKAPNDHIGQKVVVFGHITQFDSATGPDGFRANTAGEAADDWYDYDINTIVTSGEAGIFDNVVQDDLVKIYAEVVGGYSYETTLGGELMAPQLKANMIEVIGSAA